MKKIILITVCFLFARQITQAQIINPDFETWSNDLLVPTAMNPNTGNNTYGWWDYNCFNSSFIGSSPISVFRCTDTVRTGNYSVRLETVVYTPTSWNIYKTWGIPFIGHEYNDTLGILFNGNVDVVNQTYKPGNPFTSKITDYRFYYQYNPNGNDTAECRVSLMSGGQLVAGGFFKTGVATGSSGWQQAIINMTYVNGLTPDTMYVLYSSSSLDYNPTPGSVLWIDDVSVSYPVGIEQKSGEEISLSVFPNPSSTSTTIKFENISGEAYKLDIYDYAGKLVHSISNITNNQVVLNNESLNRGIYLIKLQNSKGIIYTEKMNIN